MCSLRNKQNNVEILGIGNQILDNLARKLATNGGRNSSARHDVGLNRSGNREAIREHGGRTLPHNLAFAKGSVPGSEKIRTIQDPSSPSADDECLYAHRPAGGGDWEVERSGVRECLFFQPGHTQSHGVSCAQSVTTSNSFIPPIALLSSSPR